MEQCTIGDYLENYNRQSKRGKCKACGKLVSWGRMKLSQHKRSSCPNATPEEELLFSKRPAQSDNSMDLSFGSVVSNLVTDIDMDNSQLGQAQSPKKTRTQSPETSLNKRLKGNKGSKSTSSDAAWKISDHLEKFVKATGRGTCMSCQKSVKWSKANTESHLRKSCLKNIESPRIINKTQLKSPKKVLKKAALKTSCYICDCSTGASSTRLVQGLEFTKTVLFEVLGKKNWFCIEHALELLFVFKNLSSVQASARMIW